MNWMNIAKGGEEILTIKEKGSGRGNGKTDMHQVRIPEGEE